MVWHALVLHLQAHKLLALRRTMPANEAERLIKVFGNNSFASRVSEHVQRHRAS